MDKFTSIGQFRNVVKIVRQHYARIHADHLIPTLTFIGTTKLHGCFSKDTLVTLADGSQLPINEVKLE